MKDETNDRVVQQKPSKVKRASKPKEDNQNEEEKVSCCEKVSPRSTKSRGKKEKVKEESQKPKAKKDKAEGDIKKGISKPELEIPDIIIPKKMEKIARIDGPSPWNGTISYTNKIYLGAHISAAGNCNQVRFRFNLMSRSSFLV